MAQNGPSEGTACSLLLQFSLPTGRKLQFPAEHSYGFDILFEKRQLVKGAL